MVSPLAEPGPMGHILDPHAEWDGTLSNAAVTGGLDLGLSFVGTLLGVGKGNSAEFPKPFLGVYRARWRSQPSGST